MTKTQLNKEYSAVMRQVDESVGRKEAIGLLKKARSIRKQLHHDEPDYPLIHNG